MSDQPRASDRGWRQRLLGESVWDEKKRFLVVSERVKYFILTLLGAAIALSSLLFDPPAAILGGLGRILVSPSILVTDYMVVGNPGAALFNAGALMLIATGIAKKSRVNMNGPIISAIFTIGGFALFGKNLYNVWAIFGGVLLYSRFRGEQFRSFILVAFFGTALGPLISQVSFGYGFAPIQGVVLGNLCGLLAGFCLPPMANQFVKFHQGFNLYNIGFTCGIAGMVFMAVLNGFGLENPPTLLAAEGFNRPLGIWLVVLFGIMLAAGLVYCNRPRSGLGLIVVQPGRLVSDFVSTGGFGASFINMALMGLLSTLYVVAVGGELNGPTIGGIFTIVGFGAFGKHIKNVWPLFAGVYLGAVIKIWEVHTTGALLAALFGTTLAPIAGYYGWFFGIVAGFIHVSLVMNTGILHGGMNLYNNGFTGGFVAAVLVPVFDAIKRIRREEG